MTNGGSSFSLSTRLSIPSLCTITLHYKNLKDSVGSLIHSTREWTINPIVPAAFTTKPVELTSSPGMGRLVEYEEVSQPLSHLLRRLTSGLGNPASFSLALPQGTTISDHADIRRIALCAGSGGSVLAKAAEMPASDGPVRKPNVGGELWVTGEMSHHEVLAATEKGIVVVCLGHSNSERGYLREIMKPLLERELAQDGGAATGATVHVSEQDRDPLQAVVLDARQ